MKKLTAKDIKVGMKVRRIGPTQYAESNGFKVTRDEVYIISDICDDECNLKGSSNRHCAYSIERFEVLENQELNKSHLPEYL